MKACFLSLLFVSLFSLNAQADFTIVQKVEAKGQATEMTLKIKGDRIRMEAPPQTTMIVDAKTGDTKTLAGTGKPGRSRGCDGRDGRPGEEIVTESVGVIRDHREPSKGDRAGDDTGTERTDAEGRDEVVQACAGGIAGEISPAQATRLLDELGPVGAVAADRLEVLAGQSWVTIWIAPARPASTFSSSIATSSSPGSSPNHGQSHSHSTRPYCSQPDRTQRNAFPT
jgi:hypothetical protein